jgi:glycosyltransferase involved in cell wall biosynthesis
MKQIAFIDIGAGFKGAHNTGFLDLLCKYSKTQEADITIITHQALSKEWQYKLSEQKISFVRIFDTDIFGLNIDSSTSTQINDYILQLSQEYKLAFKALVDIYPEGKVQLISHTMSWEHLMALGLAIKGSLNERFIYNVFLMYWSGINEALEYENPKLALNYKVALKRLKSCENIKLYTSNQEYLLAFQELMSDKTQIDLHPFFLGDWHADGIRQRQDNDGSKDNILLYSGEIKKEKGFYELPEILAELKNKWHKSSTITIHLSKKDLNKQQKNLVSQIKEICPTTKIIAKFLNTEDIIALYNQCNLVLLNYDSISYKNKTSGVMWLAIQAGATCIVSENTWMHRELLALNIDHFIITESQTLAFSAIPNLIEDNKYARKIYQPFWGWIVKLR